MTTDEGILYPEWQKHYLDALLELDQQQLSPRIVAAESAIAKRLQSIAGDTNHHAERRAIEDALSSLRVLKRESR
ncbi:MAG: hypothetical protein WAN03_20670 [Candidatus Sulfotelmatobacter sp.]